METGDHVSGHDQSRGIYVCLDNFTPTVLAEDGTRLHWKVGIDFFHPDQGSEPSKIIATKWQPGFTLLADDFHTLEITNQQPYHLGRLRSPEPFDPKFVKACFETCLTEHGDICSRPARKFKGRSFWTEDRRELPLRMRCIDVINHNVVHLPRNETCQYAILSYVWGQSNFLCLTKATYTLLTSVGGLKRVRVPQTISDAIEVTTAMGIRYLWVDSLCIIQDYESEKTQQIRKMDKIYASAALTIVAANTSQADGGLWHAEQNTRPAQIVEEVVGLRFIGTEPSLEDVLEDSIWKKRAWTYQEYVLSKRLLVFSDTQAYYSCEKGACAEDYVYTISMRGKQDLHYLSTDTGIGSSVDRLAQFPFFWPSLIREYTRRQLSFEADGLNAAAGVMASYSLGSNDSFICGLPLNGLFEYGMLWYPTSRLKRRGVLNEGEYFPSWSWVGWVGPVSYEDSDEIMHNKSDKMIARWCLESAQKLIHVDRGELSVQYRTSQLRAHDPGLAKKALSTKSDIDRHLSTIQSGTLSFQTACANFHIATMFYNQLEMSSDDNCEYTGLYKILHKDNWIGSIHLEHSVLERIVSRPGVLHAFIALSINCNGPWYISERSDPRIREAGAESVPLFNPNLLEGDDTQDDVYNVMLVEPRGKDSSLTRLGIGQIHKKSFDNAQPVVKDVKLA